jgi:peptide/nickel transport system permease protein
VSAVLLPEAGSQPPATTADESGGTAPWRLAVGRFARNRGAVTALVILLVIIVSCVLAPVYAHDLAHTNPFASNPAGTTVVHGKTIPVIAQNPDGLGATPIGPTWTVRYFLGADTQGRDVAARLLYAGRVSLTIGVLSALLNALLSTVIGLVAGYFGGWLDAIISRILDLIWAFPVYLLAIALATVLMVQGLHIGPVSISQTSIWLPIWLIALIYIPYLARPIRVEAQSLRRREFIESAIGQGISTRRIIFGELLPNVIPTVIVFLPLMVATNMLTESALSYLSVGVQPPNASWGTMISDGQAQLYTRPLVSIAPGVALTLTIVLLNVVADAIRDAIDPRGELPRARRFGFLRPLKKRAWVRRRAVSIGATSR